ncbi:MAG: hypothetical protein KatS3mg108_1933 [Isosphaeraceae bacterium]|nr:MAG: hypothetical protein KatS3mg108_1933 [Isosphaeraceae bacterium]
MTSRRHFLATTAPVPWLLGLGSGNRVEAPRPRLGINLSGPADWSTELPILDVFRLSRPWISQREGAPWGQGPPLQLDRNGWVQRLEPGCWAETLLCTIEGGHYPAGRYLVRYRGRGRIEFGGAARPVESAAPGQIVLDVEPAKGPIFLQIRETDPADPIRAIRVWVPAAAASAPRDPAETKVIWSPSLDRWRGLACVRFMDLQATNNSSISAWADRPTLDYATFAPKGVPLEALIDLANTLQIDPWFCIPHRADDDYVRRFATLVAERLAPGLKVFVEYSNEVWNNQFEQSRYAAERGLELKLGERPWDAAWHFTAARSIEIFRICSEIVGQRRLVRVLASQAANAYVSDQILGFRNAAQHADALAIAPYVGFNVAPDGEPPAAEVARWPLERLFDHLETVALPEVERWLADQKAVADRYQLPLIAYEAGQHLVGIQGAENNEDLTRLFHQANADPRMGRLYDRYFAAWERAGGDLICHFSSVAAWSKWGSWGLLQWDDEDPAESPKFMAAMRWARSRGQSVAVPRA